MTNTNLGEYVVICRSEDGQLYLERGEFSWVDSKVSAARYETLELAQVAADKVNERSHKNEWRGLAQAVYTGRRG